MMNNGTGLRWLRAAASVVVFSALAGAIVGAGAREVERSTFGYIHGTVELIPHGPPARCEGFTDGTSVSGMSSFKCGQDGSFAWAAVPGDRLLTVLAATATGERLSKQLKVRVGPDMQVVRLTIAMANPISISGRVDGINADNADNYFVHLPVMNISAALSPAGTFVINGAPPGRYRLELRSFTQPRVPVPTPKSRIDIDIHTGGMEFFTGLEIPSGPATVDRDGAAAPPDPSGDQPTERLACLQFGNSTCHAACSRRFPIRSAQYRECTLLCKRCKAQGR
jgi:hypothetical protein